MNLFVQNNKSHTLTYAGAKVPLCKYVRLKRTKTKVVLIIPVFKEEAEKYPRLDSAERLLIEEHFIRAWGGKHHLMFMPNHLMNYYTAMTRDRGK